MATQAAVQFEQNTMTMEASRVFTLARGAGYRREPLTVETVQRWHRMMMVRELGLCAGEYRQNAVLMGQFKAHEIPHPTKLRHMLTQLVSDTNWLLTQCNDPPLHKIARVMMRLTAMQPFQDGNKRTSFCVAAYMLAYMDQRGVLVPRMADCEAWCEAVYALNEQAAVTLLERWYCV